MHRRCSSVLGILGLLGLIALPVLAQQAFSTGALQQIADIEAVKKNFNAAQQKMSSDLVFGVLAAANNPAVSSFRNAIAPLGGVDSVTGGPASAATGARPVVTVEITGTVTPALVGAIAAQGGLVLQQSPEFGLLTASLPLDSLEAIAGRGDVRSVDSPAQGQPNSGPLPRRAPMRKASFGKLGAAFAGSVTTQGYISHGANQVAALGYIGAGVKVGVLSDSASAAGVAALIASGDLPVDTSVLPGQAGPASGADEGIAMMEIVHDMAPGASLVFATSATGVASFAANIIALKDAGCKIIVDDYTYFNEGVFQDGPIARAVNTVTAAGVTYFSAAANNGNLTEGTSGTWEGDFVSGGPVVPPIPETGLVHSFGPQNYDVLTAISTFLSLKWSDPLGASTNDYDLFILDSTGSTVKGFSARPQTGAQDPYEFVSQGTNCGTQTASGYCPAVGDRIVVVLYSGAARALHVDTERGRLSIGAAGATFGHNAGANTISMAATYWNSARTGTRPFIGFANADEFFSSDGPRKIFYNPDGSPITPDNFLFATGGGITLQKPDLAAADGVSVRTLAFHPFFGTSAAAPHAAGIAALILSASPASTPAQVKTAMTATALDSMEPGVDRDSGYGIVMALPAVLYTLSH